MPRLTWGDIRDGYIHITSAVAKTQQVRNIELDPTCSAWLDSTGAHDPSSPICPPDWLRRARAVRSRAGVHSLPDTPRHSYASYHLAKYKGMAMQLVGHESADVHAVYIRPSIAQLQVAAHTLPSIE